MLAWGFGVIAVGCESEGIRPRFDRSSAGAPNGAAGTPASGAAGASGVASAGEAGGSGDGPGNSDGGTTAAGGSPSHGSSGAPAVDAGAGGTGEEAGNGGATASGGVASGGTPGVDPPGEGGAAGAPAGEGGAAGATPEPAFPCDVRAIIESKCQRCHQDPQQNGAPFPLLTWSDTRAEYGVQLVYQAMLPAIESDFMPFTELDLEPPVQPLSSVEKETLLDWLEAGAKPADEPVACP